MKSYYYKWLYNSFIRCFIKYSLYLIEKMRKYLCCGVIKCLKNYKIKGNKKIHVKKSYILYK